MPKCEQSPKAFCGKIGEIQTFQKTATKALNIGISQFVLLKKKENDISNMFYKFQLHSKQMFFKMRLKVSKKKIKKQDYNHPPPLPTGLTDLLCLYEDLTFSSVCYVSCYRSQQWKGKIA